MNAAYARSGLTGFVAGLARQTVRHNVTINNLLPGTVATERIQALGEVADQPQAGTEVVGGNEGVGIVFASLQLGDDDGALRFALLGLVEAGLVAQIIPCAPMPLERRSPRIAAGEELAGK